MLVESDATTKIERGASVSTRGGVVLLSESQWVCQYCLSSTLERSLLITGSSDVAIFSASLANYTPRGQRILTALRHLGQIFGDE